MARVVEDVEDRDHHVSIIEPALLKQMEEGAVERDNFGIQNAGWAVRFRQRLFNVLIVELCSRLAFVRSETVARGVLLETLFDKLMPYMGSHEFS
jgi:hypothetical protein